MNYNRPELRDRLASEYVLGTLQGRARKRFQRLLKSDRTLRDNVTSWEQKLVPMGSPLSAPEPSAKVWKGIAARVGGGSAKAARPSFFERWFGMRSLAPLAAGLVLGIAITILMPAIRDIAPVAPSDGQLPQSYVGFLQDDKGNPTVLISSLRHGRSVDIKVLRPIAAGPDAVLQLWALPRDGTPFPVGTIPARGRAQLTLPQESERLLAKVNELAITVETAPAAPGTQPTGDFILRGPCVGLW